MSEFIIREEVEKERKPSKLANLCRFGRVSEDEGVLGDYLVCSNVKARKDTPYCENSCMWNNFSKLGDDLIYVELDLGKINSCLYKI